MQKRNLHRIIATSLGLLLAGGVYAAPVVAGIVYKTFGKVVANTVEIRSGGTLTIPEGALTNSSVVSADIKDSEIVSADVAADTLTAADLATDSVTAAEIAASAVGTSEVNDGTLTTTDLSASAGIVAGQLANSTVTPAKMTAAANTRSMTAEIENLAANADIGTRAFFRVPQACTVTGAHLVNKETASVGVDGSNTLVALLANATGAATIATLTQTTNLSANTATSLGSLTNTAIAAGDLLTIAITNGANADPGPMVVQVLCTVD